MENRHNLEKRLQSRRRWRNIIRMSISAFTWIGMAVLYYLGFSIFFDTPIEYQMKHSTDQLRSEYAKLSLRYDTLNMVLNNMAERDDNVFRILFESTPYDFDSDDMNKLALRHENLLSEESRELKDELTVRTTKLEDQLKELNNSYHALQERVETSKNSLDNIPAIQPIINNQLTLLTASYGMRMHPFYKTLQSHQGVDYAIPEGSSVFATADGVVDRVSLRNSTSGQTISIKHGNGYETLYCHLSKARVRRGQRVKRGDIIALSGDTGLSLAPHLHYEIRYNGMRVDPIHYFFMELTPEEYQRIIRIAQSGMQSFD